MGIWSDILDASVAGSDDARHIAALRLPTLDGWEQGRAWATWPVEGDFLTPVVSALFGGYIASLADHLLACAVFTVLAEDESFATGELHVHFFRPVREGILRIEASVLTRGKHSAYCEAEITDASGRLVARAGATQMIRARP
jgi:uncharacterized protein (TIGR00369 family)